MCTILAVTSVLYILLKAQAFLKGECYWKLHPSYFSGIESKILCPSMGKNNRKREIQKGWLNPSLLCISMNSSHSCTQNTRARALLKKEYQRSCLSIFCGCHVPAHAEHLKVKSHLRESLKDALSFFVMLFPNNVPKSSAFKGRVSSESTSYMSEILHIIETMAQTDNLVARLLQAFKNL